MKRWISLLLALALVVPVLLIVAPVTVRADDSVSFSVTQISSAGSYEYIADNDYFLSALQYCYYNNCALLYGCCFYGSCYYVIGYFWDDSGCLYTGRWLNPVSANNASSLGIVSLSNLELSLSYKISTSNVYFSKDLAEQCDGFTTGTYYAFNWSLSNSSLTCYGYYKSSYDTVWTSSDKSFSIKQFSNIYAFGSSAVTVYYPVSSASVIWSGSVSTPTLQTSLNATQRIPYGESINLFVLADNVNGDVTIDWYVNGALSESFDMYSVGSGNQAIGAWKFTPGSSGAYFVYAVVTNTVGDSSVFVTSITGHLIFYDSSGDDDSGSSGDDSGSTSGTDPTTDTSGDDDTELGTSAKLEQIETSLDEVKDAVASVEDKLDGVSDQLDGVSDQLDGVSDQLEESNSWLSNIADGITSLPEKIMDAIKGLFVPDEEAIAEQQDKWNQLLADRFGVVYESVEIVDNLAGAFTNDGTTDVIEFPTVTVPLGDIDWTLGGWEVDVVPDGFEFLIEVLKKIIDILCTLAFVNALRKRYESLIGH